MPACDIYHDVVCHALERDGWTITHDPLRIQWGNRDLFVDLGAEQLLAADKDEARIAVEVKSFASASPMTDLERAIGQFVLYLAISAAAYADLFAEPVGELLLARRRVRLVVFDPHTEELVQWIPS